MRPPGTLVTLVGNKYGKLTVIGLALSDRTNMNRPSCFSWLCRCDCGKLALVKQSKMLNGYNRSCGCRLTASREIMKAVWNVRK